MLCMALPDVATEKSYDENKLRIIRQITEEQAKDLTFIRTVIQSLEESKNLQINDNDMKSYLLRMNAFERRQLQRFEKLDEMVYEDIIAIKKQKKVEKTTMNTAKEVRKLEAGLRTLKLFTLDILKMLDPNEETTNRVEERLYYLNKRSVSLELDIQKIQQQMPFK